MTANHLYKVFFVFLVAASVPARVLGQTEIEAHLPDGSARKVGLFPESARVLFPSSRVLLEEKHVRVNLTAADAMRVRDLKLVTAREYPLERTPSAKSSAIKVTAVAYGGDLYVLNELFFDENSVVISKLLASLEVHADSAERALQVATFFIQLAQYHLEEPETFVISTFSQLSAEQLKFPGQNETDIQSAIQSPKVEKDGNAYKVDIVTRDVDSPRVLLRHWVITILDCQVISLKEDVVIPKDMHYRAEEAPSDRFGGTLASPLTDLRFQLSIIADGMTRDRSNGINVSTYIFNTSNGLQVRRSTYFFKTPERVVHEFQEQLNGAGQVLNKGKWTGTGGEVLGERALVLYATEKSNNLRAAILLMRDSDSRFFEVSSSCIRNLLEFEKVWFYPQSKAEVRSTPD